MTPLDLQLEPEPPTTPATVLAARQRRALVVGLGGGRESDQPMAKSSFAERRLRASDTATCRFVDLLPGTTARPLGAEPSAAARSAAESSATSAGATAGATAVGRALDDAPPVSVGDAAATPASNSAAGLRLDDALVVPAGALVRGYLRCRALLLVGDVVGNVHCTGGPVVIRPGASLKGRLVAAGDVYVCGTVGDAGGGAVITTPGKLTLAPGARVDGDVRCGRLDRYEGCFLQGAAKGSED